MPAFLPILAKARFRYVLCAWEAAVPADVPAVNIDYERVGYLAGAHLRDLGHRRVAVVADLPHHDIRVQGLRRAFSGAGTVVPDDAVYAAVDTVEGGYEAACQALSDHPDVTAIMASHDLLALGVLEAARARGWSVPDALSVVGIDDMAAAGHSHPPLTSVAFPKREMARRTVEIILDGVPQRRDGSRTEILETELVVRASTGRPRPSAGA
jgi:LacI family transcriptional regulator